MLSDKEIVQFLQMIKRGHNTYGELQKRFHIDDHTWVLFIEKDVIINPPQESRKRNIIDFVSVPKRYSWEYDFKDTDSFRVTIAGQNILDRAAFERRNFYLAAIAALGGVVAIIDTVLKLRE